MATFSLRYFWILGLLLGTIFAAAVYAQPGDRTTRVRAKGSDVVHAVIARIDASGIFPSDNRLLRRIAYVESKDGNDPNTFRLGYYGGIWQMDRNGFRETQATERHPGLAPKHAEIKKNFKINWANVEWSDLQKPLYSGLAARLYLSNFPDPIPTSSDIPGQARYWKEKYNTPAGAGTEQKFIDDVEALEEKEGCTINADIIFLLDESGSIGLSNFVTVREFVYNFSLSLNIGPSANQIGVLAFGRSARTAFNLNTHDTKQNLLNAIISIPYASAGRTDTADGLRLLINSGFTIGAGARLEDQSIIRLAIVLTDGISSNFFDTIAAAAEVHAFRPSILVYAIGVGDRVNDTELDAIAGTTGTVDHIDSFRSTVFQQTTDERAYQLCNTASTPVDTNEEVKGNINLGERARYQFSIPVDGLTFSIDVDNGRIIVYASKTIPNPNEAFHDMKQVCDAQLSSQCGFFVKPDNAESITKRQIPGSSNTTNETLFVAIEGGDDNNTFTIENSPGDTAKGPLEIYFYEDSPRIIQGNNSVEIDFALSRPASVVRCGIGRRPKFDCPSGRAIFSDLSPGRYVVRVEVREQEQVTIKSRKVEISSDPSYCTLHFINEGVIMREKGAVRIEFVGDGPAQEFTCQLNGKENSFPCTSPVELTGLSEGEHRVKVIPRGCGRNRRAMNIYFTA